MYSNPSSAGQGHGAAQVFDTRGILNAFVRIASMEQQQRQADEQNIARMMAQFDPSKLRAADQRKFAEMYNQLQEVHIKNKGLYRNPLKNVEAYRQATNLANEMRAFAARSRQMEDGLLMSAREVNKKNRYTPESVAKLQGYQSMSTDDIFAHNGGRMVSPADFDYIPDEIKESELKTIVQSMGQAYTEDTFEVLTHEQDKSIPEYLEKRVQRKQIRRDALPGISSVLNSRESFRARLDYEWEHMDMTQRGELRKIASQIPGIDLRNGPQMLGAVLAMGYSVLDSKETIAPNAIWEQNNKLAAEDRAFQRRVSLQNMSDARADRRSAKANAQYGNPGLIQSQYLLDALQSGDQGFAESAAAPLMSAAANMEGGRPYVYAAKRYKTADEMWNAMGGHTQPGVIGGNKKQNVNEFFNVTREDVARIHKQGGSLMVLRFNGSEKVPDPNTGYQVDVPVVNTFIVDPTKPGMDQALFGLLNNQVPGSSFARGWAPEVKLNAPSIIAKKK